jgi:methyl-accepting chemotaxis protein
MRETVRSHDDREASAQGAATNDGESPPLDRIRAEFGIGNEGRQAGPSALPVAAPADSETATSEGSPATERALSSHASTATGGLNAEAVKRTRALAGEYERAGSSEIAFLASYAPALDALVDGTVGQLDGADVSAAVAELQTGLRRLLAGAAVGVTEFGDGRSAGASDGQATAVASFDALLEALPMPAFLLDPDHTVRAYNYGIATLVGIDETEALGRDNRETIAAATYTDGRRHESLADKVIDAPRTAHEGADVERIDGDNEYTRHLVFEDRSVAKNERGEEIHISFQAVPIFDADDELQGVLEVVTDRSEERRRQAALERLVTEVCSTLDRTADGDFTARAAFADGADVLDDELLRIVRQVNATVADFEALLTEVSDGTAELAESIDSTAEAARSINRQIDDQHRTLEAAADEMASFSATMAEVAASADQVTDAAARALDAADAGRSAGRDASAAVTEVQETSRNLVEVVEELDREVAEIEAVADVIGDVADQTSVLALNANIEAARAEQGGDGFAVVADEIAELANETRSYTEDIGDRIEAVRRRTTATVDAVDTAHERIEEVDGEVDAALDALDRIDATVADAAAGIDEVATANNEQAVTVEAVVSTLDDARESAAAVDDTADSIYAGTATQEETVEELIDLVDALVAGER